MDAIQIIIIIAVVIIVIISLTTLIRINALSPRNRDKQLLTQIDTRLKQMKIDMSKELQDNAFRNDRSIMSGLISIQESTEKRLAENQQMTSQALMEGMRQLQNTTDRKLNSIQSNVNEKLDRSLNERLDSNFKQVSDRLESLYQSLGELKNLENGVLSLNKTLSNVKSRGVFGEIQLENILANTLDKSMYDANVATRPKSRDFVEYAVKIPDKENSGSFIYLPIDSKFPSDIYNKLVDASESGNSELQRLASRKLKERIRSEAKTMRYKYIAPPHTTDFAVMFLPTEGLYAEVLRIDGLAEECQQNHKVILAGPMTLTALLNSLSIGFRYLTVNKKTQEIMKTLSAFKNQFEKFDQIIDQTRRSLAAASSKADVLKDRSRMVQNKLKNIEILDDSSASDTAFDSASDPAFDSALNSSFGPSAGRKNANTEGPGEPDYYDLDADDSDAGDLDISDDSDADDLDSED